MESLINYRGANGKFQSLPVFVTGSTQDFDIVGNNASTEFTIEHNRRTLNVNVQVFDLDSKENVYVGIKRVDENTIMIKFNEPPTTDNHYRVLIYS